MIILLNGEYHRLCIKSIDKNVKKLRPKKTTPEGGLCLVLMTFNTIKVVL